MLHYIDLFEKNLVDKGIRPSTVSAYVADVNAFEDFFSEKDLRIDKLSADRVSEYIEVLKFKGLSDASIARKLSSLKVFYKFMQDSSYIKKSPCEGIKAPRVERKDEVVYLTVDEINELLELPESSSDTGARDRAILELMYASGLKVSEVCSLDLSDLNMTIGFVSVRYSGRYRMVPFGKPCKKALLEYINGSRKNLLGSKPDDGALFLSYLGERITRQGIWKIFKSYAKKVEFGEKLTPQNIRNSFAAHLIQNGADLRSLQELLGHDDIMATKVYLSVAKNRIMDVYDRAFPRA